MFGQRTYLRQTISSTQSLLFLALTIGFAVPLQASSVGCAKLLWLQRLTPAADQLVLRLQYREERRSALLAEPQESFGTLEYDLSSGEMTKRIESPEAAMLTIIGRQLTMQRGKRVRRIKLARDSELLWTVNVLAALANGSFESLQGNYVTQCSRNNDQWTLSLSPVELQSSSVRALKIDGLASSLQRFATVMNNGDTTTLFFNPR